MLMITPVAIDSLGYQYYILYAVLGGCIPILVFFLYPETMGRSLEQMDELFRDNSIAGLVRASLKKPEADVAIPRDSKKYEGSMDEFEKA